MNSNEFVDWLKGYLDSDAPWNVAKLQKKLQEVTKVTEFTQNITYNGNPPPRWDSTGVWFGGNTRSEAPVLISHGSNGKDAWAV